jgi:serine/threonine-protein kinase
LPPKTIVRIGAHGAIGEVPYRRRVQPEDTEEDVSLGIMVAHKYRIESILAAGAMGTLFAATDITLGRRIAIKVARVAPERQNELDRRLILEAQCAAHLRCEHTARVLEIGQLSSGAPFIVMDLLDGEDLETILQRAKRLQIRHAVSYVMQACVALAEAHGLGIVHRDIKPENLFLAKHLDGSRIIKLIDFGASTLVRSVAPGSASPHDPMVVGTPLYMAPERIRDPSSSDPRSDIWSLGALLSELLTGIPPFDADTVREVCQRVLHGEPSAIRVRRPDVSIPLERIVIRCLEKQPEARFTDVAALAAALARFAPPGSWELAVRARRMLVGASRSDDAAKLREDRPSTPPRPSVPPRPTPKARPPHESIPLPLTRR